MSFFKFPSRATFFLLLALTLAFFGLVLNNNDTGKGASSAVTDLTSNPKDVGRATIEFPNGLVELNREENSFEEAIHLVCKNQNSEPVVNAEVSLWGDEGLHKAGKTDQDGEIYVPHHAGSNGIVIRAAGFHEAYFLCDFSQKSQTILLSDGGVFKGRIILNGESPQPDLKTVSLSTDGWDKPDWLPKGITSTLSATSYSLSLDQQGGFAIRGLPAGWRGTIRFSKDLLLCEVSERPNLALGSRKIPSLRAGEELLIKLVNVPVAVGRVIEADGGKNISGIPITLNFDGERGVLNGHSGTSGDDGTFRIPIRPRNREAAHSLCLGTNTPPPFTAELTMDVSTGWKESVKAVPITAVGREWRLGEIELHRLGSCKVSVFDHEGQPILGALLSGPWGKFRLSEPGPVVIPVADPPGPFLVTAFGYSSERIDGPILFQDEIIVTLEKAPILIVKLPNTLGNLDGQSNLEILGKKDFRESAGSLMTSPILKSLGITGSRNGSLKQVYQFLSPTPEVKISGIRPGTPFRVQLSDRLGIVAASSDWLMLAKGSSTTISLELLNPLLALRGEVIDVEGNPVAGAEIEIYGKEDGINLAISKEDGSFEFPGLTTQQLILRVIAPGFPPYWQEELSFSTSSGPITITLDRGRDLSIFFTDEHGGPITGAALYYGWLNGGTFAKEIGNGQYLLSQVPKTAFPIHWRAGGAMGEDMIPAAVEKAHLFASGLGEVTLNLSRPEAFLRHGYVVEITSSPTPPETAFIDSGGDPLRSFIMESGQESISRIFRVEEGLVYLHFFAWAWENGIGTEYLQTSGPVSIATGESTEITVSLRE